MRVFFAFVGGIALGIMLSQLPISYVYLGVLALVGATTCVLLLLIRGRNVFLVACVLCVAISLGVFRVSLVAQSLPESFVPLLHTEVTIEGKVIREPDIRETSQRLTVRLEKEGTHTNVLVVAPLFPEVRYGDTIAVHGFFDTPQPFETNGGRTFSYDKFLAKDGIFSVVSGASVSIIAERSGADLFWGIFPDIKKAGVDALSIALPEPQASLASGLILGGKQGLGNVLLDEFIVVGLVHIVVLSGYNVMIVAEFVLRVFGVLGRRSALIVAGVAIGIFVLIAGAGAASIRAGIMASIALFGRATHRTYDAFRALLFAGLLMVLWNPLTLLYDPGFQLSFIATAGLIFGAPIVERKLSFVKSIFLREIMSATIAAQISVLPLLLYQNGLFSVVALPANILVLPVVPLAMLASVIAIIPALAVPGIAPLFGLPAYVLLSYITTLVEVLASLPLASFSVPVFPLWLVVISYVLLGIIVWHLSRAPQRRSSSH